MTAYTLPKMRKELVELRELVDARHNQVDTSSMSDEQQVAAYRDGRCSDIDLSDTALSMLLFITAREQEGTECTDILVQAAGLYVALQSQLDADISAGVAGAWERSHTAYTGLTGPMPDTLWKHAVEVAYGTGNP